jgi:hypothetical protein
MSSGTYIQTLITQGEEANMLRSGIDYIGGPRHATAKDVTHA